MDRFCCTNCFVVDEIKAFIEEEDCVGDCDFCEGKNVFIIAPGKIGGFIQVGIYRYYEDAAQQVGYCSSEGGYELPTMDISEILIQEEAIFDEIDNPYDLINAMNLDCVPYVRIHPYGPPSGDPDEIRYWDDFCIIVKRERRFTSFLPSDNSIVFPCNDSNKFFRSFTKDLIQTRVTILTSKTIIYRARIQSDNNVSYNHLEITAPNQRNSKNNRMSPTGISFFYGGLDLNTCLHEVRPDIGEKVYIGEFELTRDLLLLDLTHKLEYRKSIFNPEYSFWYDEYMRPFISHFTSDISKPIRKYDNEIDYIPTQVFTEFIRFLNIKQWYYFPDDNGNAKDVYLSGIIFNSSIKEKGKNIVLFEGPEISTDDPMAIDNHWLLYKGYSMYKVNKITIESTNYQE